MKLTHAFVSLLALSATTLILSCAQNGAAGTSSTDDESNVVQSGVGAAGSEASASEGGSVGLMAESGATNSETVDGSAYDPRVGPFSTCNYSARSSCSASADSITWGGCTIDNGFLTLSGTWNESYSGTSASTCTVPLVSGETVTRTTSGSTITISKGALSGATLTTDTNGGTTYSGVTIPNTGTSVTNSGGTRTIVVNGTHKVLKGPFGKTWFDHFITSTGLTVTGTRAAGTRNVSGSVTLYHQLAKYTAVSTFNSVAWTLSTCCYPTSGSVSTTFTGAITGTSSLAFTSTCGSANYTSTTGATSTITLNQCN